MLRKLLIAVPLLLLAACGGELAVKDIVIGSELTGDRQIVEQTGPFVPDDATLYARVDLTGLREDTEIVGAWWYEGEHEEGDGHDGDGAHRQKFFETSVAVAENRPYASFLVRSENPWPAGTYRFVVMHEGERIEKKSIVVEE